MNPCYETCSEQIEIALLIDSRYPGGIETHVCELAASLNQDYHICVLFLNDYGVHPMEQRLNLDGIHYEKLNGDFSSLLRWLERENPSVLHTHGYKSALFGRAACLFSSTAHVSTYHAGETPQGVVKVYDFFDRLTAKGSEHCFTISPHIAKRVYGECQLMNNFVALHEFPCHWGEQIAFVGRLSEEKGPDVFTQVSASLPAHDFHMYGDGPELEAVTQQKALLSATNLTIHGFKSMDDCWHKVDLLVITSRFEGMPMVAIEAMSRGIPVISSDVGNMKELIENDRNGWIVESENIDAFKNKIDLWKKLSDLRKLQMREYAAETIRRRCPAEKIVKDMVVEYENACDKPLVTRDAIQG